MLTDAWKSIYIYCLNQDEHVVVNEGIKESRSASVYSCIGNTMSVYLTMQSHSLVIDWCLKELDIMKNVCIVLYI